MDSNLFNNPAFANLSPEKLQFLLSFAYLREQQAMVPCRFFSQI